MIGAKRRSGFPIEEWWDNRTKTRKIQICGPFHNSKWVVIPNKYTPHPEYSLVALTMIRNRFKIINDVKQTILFDQVLDKMEDEKKCELFVNEYRLGNGLAPHFDHRSTYDEVIIGLSLLSSTVMTFVRGKQKIRVPVPQRSLYIISGEARYKYKHSINIKDIKERRISMTYRTIRSK